MSRYSSRSRYSYHESAWPAYVSVAERRAKAEKETAKLAKAGTTLSPVRLTGTKIASTFWGKSWCANLESYRDYSNRLPRGRSYVRNGSVIDLQLAANKVTAKVSGSSLYTVTIDIGTLPEAQWKAICLDCAGGIDSLVELLQGRLSKGAMERLCRQNAGLFPKPAEIKFNCSCPDWASMCKHVAAVLYGVGARLDTKPELLFRLRGVDERDLVANIGSNLPLGDKATSANVLEADDMAALFGLDMAEPEEAISVTDKAGAPPRAKPKPKAGANPVTVAAKPSAAAKSRPVAKASTAHGRKPAPRKPATEGATASAEPAKVENAMAVPRAKPVPPVVTPRAEAPEPVAWWLTPPRAKPANATKPVAMAAAKTVVTKTPKAPAKGSITSAPASTRSSRSVSGRR